MAVASPEQAPAVAAEATSLGPGRFVMVVGPSGAGKDSLLRGARDALAGDEHFVFPRRLVTRPPSAAEDNLETSPEAFAELKRSGGLAVDWTAHGMHYGLPGDVDEDIEAGRTVVCNVSRSVVAALRGRYANALVVEVTAPPEVLRQRLVDRGRSEDGSVDRRLARVVPVREPLRPDAVVVNAGTLDEAITTFLAILR